MTMSSSSHDTGLRIELVNQPEDLVQAFHCAAEAFGRQAQDAVWMSMNPGWETPEGKTRGAEAMVNRWTAITKDQDGNPTTIFLKATLPNPQGGRVIAGMAIWMQASSVLGRGNQPAENIPEALGLSSLYPENESEQRYLTQVMTSFFKRRIEVIKEKATTTQPAVMVLDMCAVDPAYQRKGIARALVQWGLDEAQRRGDLEAVTEASAMGRHVYGQMGFQPVGTDIVYEVDPEFAHRSRPANLFMRTRPHSV
jgi:GNAT superfamily N-acetyltransferase